ncbi:hypothetical protein ACXET9_02525 [Brachybacterium sp. DNPG3]
MTEDLHGSGRDDPSATGPGESLPSFSGASGSDGSLPDFTAQGGPVEGLPDLAGAHDGVTVGEPSERSRNRTLAITLSVVGSGVVLLAVVALVLSQTVFRSVLDDDEDDAYTAAGDRTAQGQTEYIPDEEDPDLAPPPEIFTQAPQTACSIPSDYTPAQSAPSGTVRGGDLQYTIPDDWDFPWGSSSLPYMTETDGQGRQVESNWYSVVNLGRVSWPENEGGYPGLEPTAVALFQCYATTAGVLSQFGENPTVTDYRSETFDVDGYSGWIVQATYHFEDPDSLSTTSASIVTSIVVETDDGASALVSDVAADHEDHVQGLEEIIASLTVVD